MTNFSKELTWIDGPDEEFSRYLEASGLKLRKEDKAYPVRYAVTSDFYAFNNPDYIKYSLEKLKTDVGSSTVVIFATTNSENKKVRYRENYGSQSYYTFYEYTTTDVRWSLSSREKTGVLINKTRNRAATILRFVDEVLHCAYAPAYQRAELSEVNYIDESGGPLLEDVYAAFYNYNYRSGGRRVESYKEAIERSKKWSHSSKNFLKGFPVTKQAASKAVENNVTITRTSRIKMNGAMELGEEFEVFGYEDHIVWVRNGMELWALDKPHRKSPMVSTLITKERKHLGIEEQDTTKFILTSPDKLEEMVAYSIQAMLTSITPT